MRIRAVQVREMPQVLEAGVLYVSQEFGTAAHLCACGCGSKIRTPLGPAEWTYTETALGPSLSPSIGNWQRPCKSHYWIIEGEIEWARRWTQREIEAGRATEDARRRLEFSTKPPIRTSTLTGILKRLAKILRIFQ